MAEFKISRLRFSWVGEWANTKVFNKDEIVQYEGKAYVCLIPHTSAGFYADLGDIEPKWELMMTGQTWKGPWTQFAVYSLDNIVIFGGIVYKCNTAHVAGAVLDTDVEKWDVYAESKTWQSEWTSDTQYGVGDIIQYGASAYECIISHTSAETDLEGLEADYVGLDSTLVKWKLVKEGVQWRGAYNVDSEDSAQIRYKLNDLVKYGPSVYKCIEGHAPAITQPQDYGLYTSSAITPLTGNGSDFFKKELTVRGVRLVAAGDVGSQEAVPDAFIEKVAQMFRLLIDQNGAGINVASQETLINTLSGAAGTYHTALGPTLQRIARGAGNDYSTNFLDDEGIVFWNLSPLFDSHVSNDMVWYLNSTGVIGTGDTDAGEVLEHVMHTIHMHGLDATALKIYPQISADWATGPLFLAMKEAYDGGFWDPAGYAIDWETDPEQFPVAAKEYLYLLNFAMFEYTELWEGGSLSPEWSDLMRDQAGILANNPLGYALHNTYIAPVVSKPSLATIRNMFQDGDSGDPTVAGPSGYIVEANIALGTLQDTFNSAYWELWVPGLDFDGVYDANAIYQPGDIVLYGGYLYQSLVINNINNKPSFNSEDSTDQWELVNQAYDVTGAWSGATAYRVGSVVTYGGDLYVAITDSTGRAPGDFEIDAPYQTEGSSGTTIKLQTQDSANPLAITVGMSVIGEGFGQGQTVQSVETDGVTTTVILSEEPDGTITDNAILTFVGTNWVYWELMIPGFNWEGKWATDTLYNQDDVAYYGNATYVCTREHTSALVNRPDYDLQNNYWTLYLQHDKTNSLTQKGEIIIQSGGEKTALAIGEQTNVLKVVGDLPSWTETDFTPNVYYIATNGVDSPDRGTTADTAWKTVKYACDLVAEGTRKPNEKALLEANKDWVIAETYYWFLYQQNTQEQPFDASVDFSEYSTRRDLQYTFDGVVTDLARGQNARTVQNALTYFDLESTNQYANETVAQQAEYYSVTIAQLFVNIQFALTNTAPAINYQQLEVDRLGRDLDYGIKTQYFNNALTIEGDTITTVNMLEKIIREPLEAGSPDSIPSANQGAYTTINLKSGTYEEILPIVLPERCALNGDELRGAAVKPANIINTLCTRTFGFINQFIVGSTVNMENNTKVQFVSLNPVDEISTKIGGNNIVQGTTYYVIGSSITETSFSVSAEPDGEAVELTTNIGYMYVYGGNALNDMFYVQNATGIRNMTLTGLLGTLTPQNQYETRRPTGGAYVSLDPGTGPTDTRSWITLRSPYIQNVTNFGQGCTGLKIDSTLHNGGNTSIVCNDFTQIISDGIGVWCTGGNSLVECVSVFSYYNYAGYFAEDGGRIRATNGNSSYGQYGCIAEGFDDAEIPATGNVNNRENQALAIVGPVGPEAEILKIQMNHAGEEYYTKATNLMRHSNNLVETSVWNTDGNLNITRANTTPFENEGAWRIEGITSLSDTSYFWQDIAISPQGRTYTNVPGTNIDGSGVDATFDVTVFSDRYEVAVNNGGSGYVVGNEIEISGINFGAQPLTNDIVVTVTNLSITAILTVSHIGTVPEGSALQYTSSIYAKKSTASYFDMYAEFTGFDARTSVVRFNFDTGIISAIAQSDNGIVSDTFKAEFVSDGWYRISYTYWDETAQNTSLRFKVYPRGIDGITGTTNFYGAQLQQGPLTFFLESIGDRPSAYANVNINGAGSGAQIVADELRSGGIYQTRILESRAFTQGGLGFKFQSNNAQSGDNEQITLAGSEVATPAEYENMRLFVNSGLGAGQYGIISRYDETLKKAYVLKESFNSLEILSTNSVNDRFTLSSDADFHTVYTGQRIRFTPTYFDIDVESTAQDSIQVLGTLGDLNNYIYVTSTEKLRVNQKINFTGTTFGGVITNFDYYIITIVDGTTIQISTTQGGGVWPMSNVNIEDPQGAPIVLTTETAPYTLNYPSGTSYLTGTSTADMEIAYPIQFTGTSLGDVVLGDIYYIHEIYNGTQFSISTNINEFDATATDATLNAITIADTSTLVPLNPVVFKTGVLGGLVEKQQYWINSIIDGTDFTVSDTIATTNATETEAISNLITVTSTAGFVAGSPVILSGNTFGGITNDQVYYVQVVNDATSFTISLTPSGSAVPLLQATGDVIVRTVSNTVALTTATGTMGSVSPGVKETVGAGGGATMETQFYTETFGGVSANNSYYVLEKFETVPTVTYAQAGNWSLATSNWQNETLQLEIDASAPDAFLQDIQDLGTGSVLTFVDSTLGTISITLAGEWDQIPQLGINVNVSTADTAPGLGAQELTSLTIDIDDSTIVKEFTVESVLDSGIPVSITTDTGSMQIGAVGWDHVNPGTPTAAGFDSTSIYNVEPRIKYDAPVFSQTNWEGGIGGEYTKIVSSGFKTIAFPISGANALTTSDFNFWDTQVVLPVTVDDDPTTVIWADAAYGNNTWILISTTGRCLYSASNGVTWLASDLPALGAGEEWSAITYGDGAFTAVARGSSISAYTTTGGSSWTSVNQTIGDDDWVDVAYGDHTYVAISGSSNTVKYSTDSGATWAESTVDNSGDSSANNWRQLKYGNGRFVAVSEEENFAVYSFDGITWYKSNLFVNGTQLEYGNGVFVLLEPNGVCCQSEDGINWKRVNATAENYTALGFGFDPITKVGYFVTVDSSSNTTNISTGSRAIARAKVDNTTLTSISMIQPGSGYIEAPEVEIIDPNNSQDALTQVRVGNGVLGAPSILDQGTGYNAASTVLTINGSGFSDAFQTGLSMIVRNLTRLPQPGDNIEFLGDPEIYRVAKATILRGTTVPNLECNIQLSPQMSQEKSPAHDTSFTMRSRFSQVRLTNHDFLNIGYGNQIQSNYPFLPENTNLEPQDEVQETNNGRVFYSSTDQDGNFRVGDLFAVEQATGIVTLSADEFGLDGLSELSIGGVALGGSPVVVTAFSTDGTFVANSNNLVPTQKAIRTYLTSRLSQGGSDTFTGLLQAGTVKVGGPDEITSSVEEGAEGWQIKIGTKMNQSGAFGNSGWAGDGIALSYFYKTLFDPTRSGQQ
jgi:hypothetical protein